MPAPSIPARKRRRVPESAGFIMSGSHLSSSTVMTPRAAYLLSGGTTTERWSVSSITSEKPSVQQLPSMTARSIA